MTPVQTNMGPFDKERFRQLRLLYEKNLKQELTQFEFEEHVWVRSYAHHMLVYLSPLLGFGEYRKPS